MKKSLVYYIILLFISTGTFAQQIDQSDYTNSQVVPNYTEMKVIESKIINDNYYLYIKLPKNYDETDKAYPVIYLLDGDISFTMAWSVVRYLQFGKHLPDVIIVGIGYGSLLSSDEENMRERDYTISKIDGRENSGGGDNFLKFLKTELIPFVDSEYRTDPDDRILNGYSFGGLLTMYAFLNEHDLFSGYIAGSPYLSSDKEHLKKIIIENSEILKNSKAKLFISYGSLEDDILYRNPIIEIVQSLDKVNFNRTNIKKQEFIGGSHFTCPSEAMVYGVKYLFE